MFLHAARVPPADWQVESQDVDQVGFIDEAYCNAFGDGKKSASTTGRQKFFSILTASRVKARFQADLSQKRRKPKLSSLGTSLR